jgi:hypothetical protein
LAICLEYPLRYFRRKGSLLIAAERSTAARPQLNASEQSGGRSPVVDSERGQPTLLSLFSFSYSTDDKITHP